jgi:hypothetical protein
MNRFILMVLALASFSLFGPSAFASDCAVDSYDHNGSTMEVQQCDGDLFISYSAPRSGLAKIGVIPGTLLFEGNLRPGNRVSGQARLFSAKCGEITYDVSGTTSGNSIVLSGSAPKRNSSCRVISYSTDKLLFTLNIGATPAADDWYVIAGSFRSTAAAQRVVDRLNAGRADWFIKNTRDCPNFTNGYSIATIGPMSKALATEWKDWTGQPDAYIKTCN